MNIDNKSLAMEWEPSARSTSGLCYKEAVDDFVLFSRV